jgi:hypothetical protein
VLNGTAQDGLAGTVAEQMRAQGFTVANVGNEAGTVNQTIVRYGPNVLEPAKTVAAAVPNSVLQASDSIGDTVQLVLGPGFESVVPVEVGAPQPAPSEPTASPKAASPAPAAPVSC